MVSILKPGDKVTYEPTSEHGIVKDVTQHGQAFVVFNCGGDWENYRNYTASFCSNKDLALGWKDEEYYEAPEKQQR